MASRPERFRRAYRIVSRRYATFDGSGTFRWGSRWVSPGRRIVHAAETYALAVLENLVHWQTRDLPQTLVVIEVRTPEDVAQSRLDPSDVPGWDHPDYAASRAGDAWYDACERRCSGYHPSCHLTSSTCCSTSDTRSSDVS